MPFSLIAPGQRKTVKGGKTYLNKFIVIRGSRNGIPFEHSAKTLDPAIAQRRGEELERDLALKQDDKTAPTFEDMVDLYIAAKQPGRNDRRYLRLLRAHFKGWLSTDIKSSDLAKAAHKIYRGCANETKNRHCIVPAAAVLHFAAEDDRIPYVKIKKLSERQPEGRALPWPDAQTLMAKSEGDLHRWLVFIFYQGWRVTESISLHSDHIDFEAMAIRVYISKIRRWKTVPMHPETAKVLEGVAGKVFPWIDRHQLYDDLNPLCKALGIRFTPHMARHTFGTRLNAVDASPRDITTVGTWRDPKSVMRYTEVDSNRAKDIMGRLTDGGTRGNIDDAK